MAKAPPSETHWLLRFVVQRHAIIAVVTVICLVVYLVLRPGRWERLPLNVALIVGGIPLVAELIWQLFHGEWGSDLLAGVSIVTAVLLDEPLAATLVVLMLSGGEALEALAVSRASSVLGALSRRMPSIGHRRGSGEMEDVALDAIQVGDVLIVLPHEICPVDGVVVEGHGSMDEAYLTGEPYQLSKSVGSEVLSGAINGESALAVRATRLPVDSRYARIMRVMEESEQHRPRMRRLGDRLGAVYTPLAIVAAGVAALVSGDPLRFLAVLVIATPCPLLIAIPVAIIGTVSLAARRGIIVRDPSILENLGQCRTMIFDKTGTLTYGEPALDERIVAPGFDDLEVLRKAAGLERYSRHPLAQAVVDAARVAAVIPDAAEEVSEVPGQGLVGVVRGQGVRITSRKLWLKDHPEDTPSMPPQTAGLECLVIVGERRAAVYRFRDQPRADGRKFVGHLAPAHAISHVMLVSGDRASEVEYLAEQVGITEVHAGKSPEEKLQIVREETSRRRTIYVGDGINDAPAMMAATVGLAMGQRNEVTSEAAGAVILDCQLVRVDELMHIGTRMKHIAMQSAVGGMLLSAVGMVIAAFGWLPPVSGAIAQEVIDVVAVLNALRAAWPPKALSDMEEGA